MVLSSLTAGVSVLKGRTNCTVSLSHEVRCQAFGMV
jgi:hypothetical protein